MKIRRFNISTYYDGVTQKQESTLRIPLGRVLDVAYRSVLGEDPPENFSFEFESLWQLSDKEKAEVAEITTRTVLSAQEAGLVSDKTALNELRQSADVTGIWSGISDEEIKAADELPPDPSEMMPDAEAADLRSGDKDKVEPVGVGPEPEG